MGTVLRIASVAEAVTGLALLIAPSIVGVLLFGQDLTGLALPAARIAGVALLSLAIACWPNSQQLGMLTYSLGAAGVLLFHGLTADFRGTLLWPAILAHLILLALLGRELLMDLLRSK
jgi:hypothetical protein